MLSFIKEKKIYFQNISLKSLSNIKKTIINDNLLTNFIVNYLIRLYFFNYLDTTSFLIITYKDLFSYSSNKKYL